MNSTDDSIHPQQRLANQIVQDRDALHQVCLPVPKEDFDKAKKLITNLINASKGLNGFKGLVCLGLAANQIGATARIFVVRKRNKKYKVFINPSIIRKSEPVDSIEGCYSCPGEQVTMKRHSNIVVKAMNIIGTLTLQGREALAFQHELDHLDGKLITDLPEMFNVVTGIDVATQE
jgi:peptide deformylase